MHEHKSIHPPIAAEVDEAWLRERLAPLLAVSADSTESIRTATERRIDEGSSPAGLRPLRLRRQPMAVAVAVASILLLASPPGQQAIATASDAIGAFIERAVEPAPPRPGDRIAPAPEPKIDERPAR